MNKLVLVKTKISIARVNTSQTKGELEKHKAENR